MQKNIKNAMRILIKVFKQEGVKAKAEAMRVAKSKDAKVLMKEFKTGAKITEAQLKREVSKLAVKGKAFSKKVYHKARSKAKSLRKKRR